MTFIEFLLLWTEILPLMPVFLASFLISGSDLYRDMGQNPLMFEILGDL